MKKKTEIKKIIQIEWNEKVIWKNWYKREKKRINTQECHWIFGDIKSGHWPPLKQVYHYNNVVVVIIITIIICDGGGGTGSFRFIFRHLWIPWIYVKYDVDMRKQSIHILWPASMWCWWCWRKRMLISVISKRTHLTHTQFDGFRYFFHVKTSKMFLQRICDGFCAFLGVTMYVPIPLHIFKVIF